MKRGDIVIVRQKGVFTSKPRPAVIVQASALLAEASAAVVCLVTGERVDDPPFFRIDIEPTSANGLTKASQIMADRPIPVLTSNIAQTIGTLEAERLAALNAALLLMLELG